MQEPDNHITLKNSGELEFNDRAYDRLFELAGKSFQFVIKPKTRFWRFGIRFSKIDKVEFFHPQARYAGPEYPNIEINAGVWVAGKEWQQPDRIEFSSYDMPGLRNGEPFDRWEKYDPLTEVIVDLRHEASSTHISYKTANGHFFERAISLPGFNYFKLFAWADKIDYELDCEIYESETTPKNYNDPNILQSQNKSADINPPRQKKYWLLKLSRDKYISGLAPGAFTTLYSKDDGNLSADGLPSFQQLQSGDEIIGFDPEEINAAIGVFVVSNLLFTDPRNVTAVELRISVVFNPYLPLNLFRDKISSADVKLSATGKRVIEINQQEFKAVLDSVLVTTKKLSYYPSYMTEGNNEKKLDQLEFTNDIESIASLIALKTVNPPLAIGLFGNWGSGKSFFMEKLEARIDKYAETKNPVYVTNVVQVKFDSWHYSDANLWASLISVIFDSLNKYAQKNDPNEMIKLSDTLEFQIVQRGMVEAQKKELQVKVDELQTEQKNKRDRLLDISGIGLVKLILTDEKVKNDLSELNDKNIESIVTDKSKIDGYIDELNSTKNTLSFYFKEVTSFKGWTWVYIILAVVVLFLFALLVKNVFNTQWNLLTLKISGIFSLVAALLSKSLLALKPYRDTLNKAMSRLTSLKKTIESRETVQPVQLTAQEIELQSLTVSLQTIDQDITETKSQIYNIISGKKLLTFIQDRSKDESYSKQLGLISWIRKDFDTLDKLLREQHLMTEDKKRTDILPINPKDVKLSIDRIILYIDDLDRCNEDIVVRVLEAIHLLLAFPLFVVVVGVDPRWLNRSLDKKMSTQFGGDSNGTGNKAQTDVLQATTSFDYLEKIFQIPFSIKPINKTGRESLISYLMKDEMEKVISTGTTPATPPAPSVSGTAGSPNTNAPATSATTGQGAIPQNPPTTTTTDGTPLQNTLPEDRVILSFKKEELEFIQRLSPIFAKSPRSINRYVNIYRIIRSHGGLNIEDQNSVKEYLPVMFLLAVIVGYSENAPDFIKKVIETDPTVSLSKVFDDLTEPMGASSGKFRPLVKEMKAILDPMFLASSMSEFQKNIELISRFSFRPILVDAVK